MTPYQLSAQLRHIATKISNSKSPRRDLVARDLKNLINKLAAGDKILPMIMDGTIYDVDMILTLTSGEEIVVFVTKYKPWKITGYMVNDSGKRKNYVEISTFEVRKAEFKHDSDAKRFDMK